MARIAIEATGCDEGFTTILEGTKRALEKDKSLELILVAGKDKMPEEYSHLKEIEGVPLEKAEYTFDSENKSTQKESSIYRAIEMHKSGEVDAVIAPGDTKGAIVCSSRILRRMLKVYMPAIATHIPFNNVLIDSGANPECKSKYLFQFAIMGKVYSKNYVGVENPLIGLLTYGEEKTKGNTLVLESRPLIEKLRDKGYNISKKNFEGDFMMRENAGQVVVTDGNIGNIVLKLAEGLLRFWPNKLSEEIRNQSLIRQWHAKKGIEIPIRNLKERYDWRNHAVAPLLGVNGNIMICHSRSNEEAIASAIKLTEKYLSYGINSKLEEEIIRCG